MTAKAYLTPTLPTADDLHAVEVLYLGQVAVTADLTSTGNGWIVFGKPQKVLDELEALLKRGVFVTGRMLWVQAKADECSSIAFADVNALIRDLRGRLKRKQGRPSENGQEQPT